MIVFISSPYAGDIEKNTEAARRYCRYAVEQGHTPIAPHLLYPQFLDEKSEAERALGLQMGLQLLNLCDEVWAFAGKEHRLSPGMAAEIAYAEENMIPIRYMSEDSYNFYDREANQADNTDKIPDTTR